MKKNNIKFIDLFEGLGVFIQTVSKRAAGRVFAAGLCVNRLNLTEKRSSVKLTGDTRYISSRDTLKYDHQGSPLVRVDH